MAEQSMGPRDFFRKEAAIADLALLACPGAEELCNLVDGHLVRWAREVGMNVDTFIIPSDCPRFQSGDAKGLVKASTRGDDLYIFVDPGNYSVTYNLFGYENHLSPDDHFQDLKRAIAAIGGKARRVNVIMPYLYESRQSKRVGRESLDCASALQELTKMGVENIITFDAHDARVQNATPLHGFETIQPAYQFLKALLNNVDGLHIDNDHFMIISPDEGSMRRAIYLANVLGVDMGMYYRRLDYSRRVNGRHPIAAYEFLGPKLEGKDVILIDDMISSGKSILEIASLLKARGAGKIFICTTFGLFTDGMDKFDKAYKDGIFDKLLTTNLVYQTPDLLSKPYYISCDMSKYIALIIDTLNHDMSVSHLLNPVDRIKRCVTNYMARYDK